MSGSGRGRGGSEPYARELRRADVDPDPARQFEGWFAEAATSGVRFPEAACLATSDAVGAPSARMVLARPSPDGTFAVYTNRESEKARNIAERGSVALLFYWDPLGRQVRAEGTATPLADAECDAYFAERPRGHKVASWASRQSRAVSGRAALENAAGEIAARFEGVDPPRPPSWGGYRAVPTTFEFWQHRDDRLHDRFRYRREHDAWVIERLAP